MHTGWVQVARAGELAGDVNPVQVGRRWLLVVRDDGGWAAYDAICPHRGANLGFGGRREGDVIVCPFHGRRVHLGDDGQPYCVDRYRTLEVGGAVFVLLDERHENGFTEFMTRVVATHYLVEGPLLSVAVAPEYVIENVFDADHFQVVHGLPTRPELACREGERGELVVEGVFRTERPNQWQQTGQGDGPAGPAEAHFAARVFSPTVVAAELGPRELPNVVVTAATPTGDTANCVIRVLVAMAPTPDGGSPLVRAVGSLMNGTLTAFEQDRVIWEHLDTSAPNRLAPCDHLVVAFRDFCRRFAPAGPG